MDSGDLLIGGAVALAIYYLMRSHKNVLQGNQYLNSTQATGTGVCSCCYTYPCCGRRTPMGTRVVAKAGACAPISSQCTNPVTPQQTATYNKPSVPTGIFTLDNGVTVSVTCSDATTVQWYDTNDVLVGQNPVPASGIVQFSIPNGGQIDHCVLIGPGGSTIVANTIAPLLPAVGVQASPGSATANPTASRVTNRVIPRNTLGPILFKTVTTNTAATTPIVPAAGASAPFTSKGSCIPATTKFVPGGIGITAVPL